MQNLEKSTTKMKITGTKVLSVGGDGGAVEEMMEIWPKLARSHQIRRDLARSGEISLDPVRSHLRLASRTLTSTLSSPLLLHMLASSVHLSTPTTSSAKTQNQKNSINTKSEG